ncbi:TPA: HNH endonuclease [Klebsiella pneumoniae]|uniref:HNH endonuclease n=1 Tax=Klebsiella pneumoniae TaxID=573 RepID=UPI001F4B1C6B|nr:HNH endonuclease [Klebsiella pneumoniae]HBW1395550.1 HNH endonuclease [Klebsiella pneumoniae]HEE0960667.1 hypothetical protein [Klebsiella pneumoniae]
MGKKSCVFCGKSSDEVKITKEHVLPRWLKKVVQQGKWNGYVSSSMEEDPVSRSIHGQTIFDNTISVVCGGCNNGWMSIDLEVPVSNFLPSLIFGQPITLGREELDVLSLWAAKTAFMRMLQDGDSVLPGSYYKSLSNLQLPSSVSVLLGAREPIGNQAVQTRAFRLKDMMGGHAFACGIEIHSLLLIITSFTTMYSGIYDKQTRFNSSLPIKMIPISNKDIQEITTPLTTQTLLSINDVIEPPIELIFPIFKSNKVNVGHINKGR